MAAQDGPRHNKYSMEINLENHGACIARIMARGSIGKEEARALLEEVAEAGRRQQLTGVEDPIATAAWAMARDLKQAATERKADAVLNASKRIERNNEATTGGTIDKALNTLRGSLFWLSGESDKQNVQTLWRTLSGQWNSAYWAKLHKAGLIEAARDPEMFQDIAREVWKLRTGMAAVELPTNSPARQIAEIIFESQEAQRGRLNSEGARIFDAKDWIAQTSHDQTLIQRGGRGAQPAANADEAFASWWKVVKDRLDESTFADVVPKAGQTMAEARERFGRDVFNSLYTGLHLRTGVTEGPTFEAGGYNIARKLSQGRTLFWKDADAWSEYMAQYGQHRNWLSLMDRTTDANARRAALMNFWGTNPGRNLNLVMRNIAEKFQDSDPAGVDKFLTQSKPFWQDNIKTVMSLLDGTADTVADQAAAQIGRTARAITNMSYLGGVALTHASSLLTTVTSDAGFHGVNRLSSLGNMVRSWFTNLKGEERIEFLAQAGAYGDALARQSVDHFAHGWSWSKDEGYMIPGMISAAQSRYMQATGLPFIFDHTKAGWKEMLMDTYARRLGTDFDKLGAHEQKMLGSYGIGSDEWKLLATAQLTEGNGRKYLTPSVPASMDRAAIEAHLRANGTIGAKMSADNVNRAIDGFKTNLSDRLGMLYQDAADLSVVTAGVRERAILRGTTASGSWQDEIRQAMLQFHSWPLAAMHQIVARQMYDTLSKNEAVWFGGMAFVMTMVGGYIRSLIRDLSNGVPPQEPRTVGEVAKFIPYWAAQGGGLGILGDMVFGELNRAPSAGGAFSGGGTAIGGPIMGGALGLAHTFTHYMQSIGTDKSVDLWAELGKPIAGHLPFANLIYLKGALNYMIFFHAFEAMHPGWWQRTNEQMQKESGRVHAGFKPYQKPPYSPF